ncbi:MAG: response regulator transcription factor [Pyrinomonadaceae bacterium]|nr:response regulator transcription factor [Pyrinomonadaceae bacterium]
MNKLRVLLADDHMIVREGLKTLINGQPDMQVVGEAVNGREALKCAIELSPDLVVMDISMPEMNGVEATERLRKECPQIKIIALTIYEDISYLRQLLKAGASGYVIKRAVVEELVHAVRTCAAGGSYIEPTLAGQVVSTYINRGSGLGGPSQGELSDRETQVLRLVAFGYSNKEIGAKLGISVKTVETYKVRLMGKLNLRSRVEMVRYALRQGLLRDE